MTHSSLTIRGYFMLCSVHIDSRPDLSLPNVVTILRSHSTIDWRKVVKHLVVPRGSILRGSIEQVVSRMLSSNEPPSWNDLADALCMESYDQEAETVLFDCLGKCNLKPIELIKSQNVQYACIRTPLQMFTSQTQLLVIIG